MEKYSNKYLRTHCVDFYFSFRNKPFHIVTDGCLVPDFLSSIETNRKLQHFFADYYPSDGIDALEGDCIVNENYLRSIFEMAQERLEQLNKDTQLNDSDVEIFLPSRQDLLASHLYMSALGFYSYSCVWDNVDETDCHFVLVSEPKSTKEFDNIQDLPQCSEDEIAMDDIKHFRWRFNNKHEELHL